MAVCTKVSSSQDDLELNPKRRSAGRLYEFHRGFQLGAGFPAYILKYIELAVDYELVVIGSGGVSMM